MDHLLNWLCQGGVLTVATAMALRLLRRSRAKARYAVCWVSLLAVLLLPLLPAAAVAESPAEPVSDITLVAPLVSVPRVWWTSGTMVVALWTLWIAGSCVHALRSIVSMRRLVTNSHLFPDAVESRLGDWNRVRMRGPCTRLVVSAEIRSAAVVGARRPVIAVAPALLRGLTIDELDAVVIHEWAHVQRRDHLLNVGHVAARAVAGWHPAVWWLERQLRIEREAACDEIAIGITGSSKGYAACLATLAGLMPARTQATAVVGALSSPGLRRRVMRILSHQTLLPARRSTGAATVAVVLLGVLSPPIAGLRLADRVESAGRGAAASAIAIASELRPQLSSLRFVEQSPAPPRRMASLPVAVSSRGDAQNIEPQPSERVVPGSGQQSDAVDPTQPPPAMTHVPAAHSVPLSPLELLVRTTPAPLAVAAPAAVTPPRAVRSTPWATAAGGGVTVGKASQRAAVATAGFFTRFGKKVAASF